MTSPNGTPVDDGDRSWEHEQAEAIREDPHHILDVLRTQAAELDRLRAIERRAIELRNQSAMIDADAFRAARHILEGHK